MLLNLGISHLCGFHLLPAEHWHKLIMWRIKTTFVISVWVLIGLLLMLTKACYLGWLLHWNLKADSTFTTAHTSHSFPGQLSWTCSYSSRTEESEALWLKLCLFSAFDSSICLLFMQCKPCVAGTPPAELYFLFVGVTFLEDIPVLPIQPANLAAALLQGCLSVLPALDTIGVGFAFESAFKSFVSYLR